MFLLSCYCEILIIRRWEGRAFLLLVVGSEDGMVGWIWLFSCLCWGGCELGEGKNASLNVSRRQVRRFVIIENDSEE